LERLGLLFTLAVAAGFRLYRLAADGFADDEVHKWLAALRYLHGDFGGDDVEHPMLMKLLIAAVTWAAPKGVAPEFLTRLPNVVGSVLMVWATAQLGKRLFGKAAGLWGAGAYALSATAIGYGRIAKEDTLLGLFLLLLLWCLAEAFAAARDGRSAAQGRWELYGAAALGGMFASKYFFFLFPVPLFAYAWLRRQDGAFRIPLRRWVMLVGVALGVFLALDWVVLLPSTWEYLRHYIAGDKLGDRASSETMFFMGKLYDNMGIHYRHGTPIWFHAVFAAVKLTPLCVLFAALGLALALIRRAPAHRLVLVVLGWFFFCFLLINAKYARYFVPLLPLCTLLSGHAMMEAARWLGRAAGRPSLARGFAVALGLALVAPEAMASIRLAPEYRLYVNRLGGGDGRLDYYFPHCDYFDAGVREAVAWIAAHAEPNAEVATETLWLVDYYARLAGRSDLAVEPITRASACRAGGPCYVMVQPGRLYGHNREALERLVPTESIHGVEVAGHSAVRIYRKGPMEALFPPPRAPGELSRSAP
jgi:4-amino-4-deoxy-L-arabinose transferase-like glycosyltransferase